MDDFIKAEGISFSYHVEEGQEAINVFEDLNVTIRQGELTAVLGHNGSGKSTFAKLGKNENVTLPILLDICEYLQCDFGDIMEAVPEQKEQ